MRLLPKMPARFETDFCAFAIWGRRCANGFCAGCSPGFCTMLTGPSASTAHACAKRNYQHSKSYCKHSLSRVSIVEQEILYIEIKQRIRMLDLAMVCYAMAHQSTRQCLSSCDQCIGFECDVSLSSMLGSVLVQNVSFVWETCMFQAALDLANDKDRLCRCRMATSTFWIQFARCGTLGMVDVCMSCGFAKIFSSSWRVDVHSRLVPPLQWGCSISRSLCSPCPPCSA